MEITGKSIKHLLVDKSKLRQSYKGCLYSLSVSSFLPDIHDILFCNWVIWGYGGIYSYETLRNESLLKSCRNLWYWILTKSRVFFVSSFLVGIEYALVLGEIENYWLTFYFLLYTHILLSQRDAFAWGKKKSDMSELVYLHANV